MECTRRGVHWSVDWDKVLAPLNMSFGLSVVKIGSSFRIILDQEGWVYVKEIEHRCWAPSCPEGALDIGKVVVKAIEDGRRDPRGANGEKPSCSH